MPNVFRKINQAYIDADLEANKDVMRKQFRFVAQNKQPDKRPSILEDITVFNVDKYFEELRSDIQNIIDNYINNRKMTNAGKMITNFNILTNYINTFIKQNTVSQKDRAKIEDKFDELTDLLKQATDIAVKQNFSDKSQVNQVFQNVSDRFYQPVQMNKQQAKEFNEMIKKFEMPEMPNLTNVPERIEYLFNDIFTRVDYINDEPVKFFDTLDKKTQKSLVAKFEEFKNKVFRAEKSGDTGKAVYKRYFDGLYDELFNLANAESNVFISPDEEIKALNEAGLADFEGIDQAVESEFKILKELYLQSRPPTRGALKRETIKELREQARQNTLKDIIGWYQTYGELPEGVRAKSKTLLQELREPQPPTKEKRVLRREIQEEFRRREAERQEAERLEAEQQKRARIEAEKRAQLEAKKQAELKKKKEFIEAVGKREGEKRKREAEMREAQLEADRLELERREAERREAELDEEYRKFYGEGRPRKVGRPKKSPIKKVGRPKKTTVKKKAGRPKKMNTKKQINKMVNEILEISKDNAMPESEIIVEVVADPEMNPFEVLGTGKKRRGRPRGSGLKNAYRMKQKA